MKFLINRITMILIVLMAQNALSQTEDINSIGSDFKFVYLQNRILNNGEKMNKNHDMIKLYVYVTNHESQAIDVNFRSYEQQDEVKFKNGSTVIDHISIPANSTIQIEVFVDAYEDIIQAQLTQNLQVQNKMIRVWTNEIVTVGSNQIPAKLTVYAESSQVRSRDAAMILPQKSLGGHYFIFTGNEVYMENNKPVNKTTESANNGGPSEIGILATEDIHVTVNAPTALLGRSLGSPNLYSTTLDPESSNNDNVLQFILLEGQAIQLQSDAYDLSGTEIIAKKYNSNVPIPTISNEDGKCAVFAGNMAAQIVNDESNASLGAFDHVYEQMYPLQTWGCQYIGLNTTYDGNDQNEKKDLYKIIAGYDNTIINSLDLGDYSIASTITLDRGEYIYVNQESVIDADGNVVNVIDPLSTSSSTYDYDYNSTLNPVFQVNASRPIGVAQYTASTDATDNDFQDPSMMLLSPSSQRLENVSFVTLPWQGNGGNNCSDQTHKKDYLVVIADLADIGDIELNSTAISTLGTWSSVGITDWRYMYVPVTNTGSTAIIHNLAYNTSATNPEGFISYIYGMNCKETYSYAAGINAIPKGTNELFIASCIETGDENSIVDKSTLDDALIAFGGEGSTYSWSLISTPNDFSENNINDILISTSIASPNFKIDLDKVGDYVFNCTISNEEIGDCDMSFEVIVRVPSCCEIRAIDYQSADNIVRHFESWQDRIFIDDYQIITVEGDAELNINNADVVFGRCAGIVVQPGGILRANNSVFRSCNSKDAWSGIHFEYDSETEYENLSLFNECTFKHAVNAIQVDNGVSVGIHNNLFLNNYTGVRIVGNPEGEESMSEYTKQIVGNRFMLDNLPFNIEVACALEGENNIEEYKHFGIMATTVEFLEDISGNEFTNTTESQYQRDFVGVVLNQSKASILRNSFTEMYHGMQVDNSNTIITSNTFDVTDNNLNKAQIDVRNSLSNTEIRNNELTCLGDASHERGIYIIDCDHVSITENIINSFSIGIESVENYHSLISSNELKNVVRFGIYAQGITPPLIDDKNLIISCNTVDLDMNLIGIASVGVGLVDGDQQATISSNCLFDCSVSIYVSSSSEFTISPVIQNNFMYNYDMAGIYFENGTNNNSVGASRVSQNTYASNSSAWDVYCNTTSPNPDFYINNSFGLSAIPGNVKIPSGSSNVPFSTASCGTQIFRLGIPTASSTSTTDLNYDYAENEELDLNQPEFKCDNNYNTGILDVRPSSEGENLDWLGYIQALSVEDLEALQTPFSEGDIAQLMYHAFDLGLYSQLDMLNNHVSNGKYTSEVKYKTNIYYQILLNNYNAAIAILKEADFSENLNDWKIINIIKLKIAMNSIGSLSNVDIAQLIDLSKISNQYGSEAVAILNQLSHPAKLSYITEKEMESIGKKPIPAKRNAEGELTVYPNPASTSINLFISELGSTVNHISIMDVNGKVLLNQPVDISYGQISVQIDKLPDGIYSVILHLENEQIKSGRFMKL